MADVSERGGNHADHQRLDRDHQRKAGSGFEHAHVVISSPGTSGEGACGDCYAAVQHNNMQSRLQFLQSVGEDPVEDRVDMLKVIIQIEFFVDLLR